MFTIGPIGLRKKVLWSVAAPCTLVVAFAAAIMHLQLTEIDHLAQLQGTYAARSVAFSANMQSDSMQRYVEGIGRLHHSDLFIVNSERRIVADVDTEEIGRIFDRDGADVVAQTLRDGVARTFIEHDERVPEGMHQVVVPIRAGLMDDDKVVGALILQYSALREKLVDESLWRICLVAGAALASALLVGMRLGNAIAARLGRLQAGVQYMAAGHYEERVAVDGGDEIGSLQKAVNQMAADLQASRRRQEEDLEREKSSARQIEHLAYYDKLTGLPNRSLFSRLLERSIAEARRHKHQVAVMFVDLDRFKNINDTLGHDAGDALLKEAAVRAKAVLRDSDAICRLGGDEFVVLVGDAGGPEAMATVAQKILAALAIPYRIADHEFRITASIGISAFPGDGSDEASLMKHADIAMYQAKEDGKNTFAFYADSLNTHSVERLAFESSLRHALEESQFEVYYQPKVDCGSGRMTGVEALLRWHHPDLGLVPPVKFIPIAEETGLIIPIGRWVLETACRQQVEWCRQGLAPMSVAVNLSGHQLADERLLADVDAALAATGIDPTMLEIEITESVLMRDVRKGIEVLGAFKQRGIRLSIDDFGTGYSSLSTLKLFPIDTLKVDRSFVRELPLNQDDRAIADAIIAMGNTLGLSVVAEGVETADQVDFLRAHGCSQMQGFFFSRAVPAAQIEKLLAAQPTGVLVGTDLTPAERRHASDSAFMTLA